jgi:hypothetical protein
VKVRNGAREIAHAAAAALWWAVDMRFRPLFIAVAAVLAVPATAVAQDPTWTVVRPAATWDNHWRLQPKGQPLHTLLDEQVYLDDRLAVSGDLAYATRRKQRFAIGFSDVPAGDESFNGGQAWLYIGIRKRTRVDIAIRTRRDGVVRIVSSMKRVTPPITLAPENPPVGKNGFRGWLPIGLPRMTPDEVNHMSLAVRISPSSPKRSLSRVYAAFAELYPPL